MKIDPSRHILVTGIMRSGTTYVGDILSKHPDLFYLHEPFSKQTGIEGVNHWFPYSHTSNDYYAGLLQKFISLDFKYRYFEPRKGGLPVKLIKRIIGGSAQWNGWKYQYLYSKQRNMLIKDPLSSLLSKRYIEDYGIKVIFMIRHPYAFFHSNKRLGWDFDLSNIKNQNQFVDEYLKAELEYLVDETMNYPRKMAILWRCIYSYLDQLVQTDLGQNIMIVRHEDVCTEPEKVFNDIFDFIGLRKNPEIANLIAESTSSDNDVDVKEKTHVLNRNSAALVDYWKKNVGKDEIESMEPVVSDLLNKYYSNNIQKK